MLLEGRSISNVYTGYHKGSQLSTIFISNCVKKQLAPFFSSCSFPFFVPSYVCTASACSCVFSLVSKQPLFLCGLHSHFICCNGFFLFFSTCGKLQPSPCLFNAIRFVLLLKERLISNVYTEYHQSSQLSTICVFQRVKIISLHLSSLLVLFFFFDPSYVCNASASSCFVTLFLCDLHNHFTCCNCFSLFSFSCYSRAFALRILHRIQPR